MNRLLLAWVVAASLAGCGGDDEDSTTTASLSKCPPSSGGDLSAGSWGGSVSGISCEEAGTFIRDHAVRDFGPYQTKAGLDDSGTFVSAQFDCDYAPLEGKDQGQGWHATCRDGDQVTAFNITP